MTPEKTQAILFICEAAKVPVSLDIAADGYQYEGEIGTWTREADEILIVPTQTGKTLVFKGKLHRTIPWTISVTIQR